MSKQVLNCPKVALKKCKMHRILAESVRLQQVTRQVDPSGTDKFADTNTKPSTASPTSVIHTTKKPHNNMSDNNISAINTREKPVVLSALPLLDDGEGGGFQKTSIPYHTLIMSITS